MKSINIGIFPCGSEVGLEAYRALKYYRHFNLVGLSSVDDHGKIVFENYVDGIPFITNSDFIPKLKSILKSNNIEYLIPAMDEVAYILKENEDELGCEVVYPELDIANVIRRKSESYKRLSGVINVPNMYTTHKDIKDNLPIFVKPDIGYGSKGTYKITKESDIPIELDSNSLYLDYLSGDEFTIDCFSDNNNDIVFCGARDRARIRMGISVSTQPADIQNEFKPIAQTISKELGMKGIWFFQMKRNDSGELYLMEIAGRVSGSMALFRGIGVNFIAMELFRRMGNDVNLLTNSSQNILLERAFSTNLRLDISYDEVYCDLDDCLILGDKVNTKLLEFLYQSIHKGKRITLITKHQKDPKITLNEFKIGDIFDEIIHLNSDELKSNHIKNNNSIFIDDSYKERLDVKSNNKIDVFSPDMIELIIDKSY